MQYDQKIKTVFSAQNNDFTILREHRMGRQGIIYSDITRAGGKTHIPHSVACYKLKYFTHGVSYLSIQPFKEGPDNC